MAIKSSLRLNILGQASNQVCLDPGGQAILKILLKGVLPTDDLTVDLYPVETPRHPDRHYGYWVFQNIVPGEISLQLNFSQVNDSSVSLAGNNQVLHPVHA